MWWTWYSEYTYVYITRKKNSNFDSFVTVVVGGLPKIHPLNTEIEKRKTKLYQKVYCSMIKSKQYKNFGDYIFDL